MTNDNTEHRHENASPSEAERSFAEPAMPEERLVALANAARRRAYVPYSNFAVGAVVVMEDGRAYIGANIENAAYPASICAERVALTKAVTESTSPPAAICVVADTEAPVTPCGVCRQVIAELCPPSMPVYLGTTSGAWVKTTVERLLPGAFGKGALFRRDRGDASRA
ncbi:MAG: cytidine deaminase [Hydrogenibacillus sp.]|nr:cytidine deaminase [Hydrogenibacillus sp.]